LARAGFHALSTENNHSGDLGSEGRQETARALRVEGMRSVNFDGGPSFFRVGGITVAVIAVNLVPSRTGTVQDVPSVPLRQQLRLASQLAQAVIVSVHWGDELLDWPSARQREAASWLAANGASVVVGHHPHVVQPAECVSGRPVFFSVGNHLFDQKYPATKEGLIADCAIEGAGLVCGAIATRTQMRSFFPEVTGGSDTTSTALQGCTVPLNKPMRAEDTLLYRSPASDGSSLVLEGIRDGHVAFRSRPVRTLSAELTNLAGRDQPPLLLTLERHPSPLDGEDGIRPYVYEVGPRGLIARWRGSGLAWPLVDATILPGSPDLLCALHRRDSFLTLDPGAPADRVAVYQWNSFGFSGVQDAVALRACRKVWNLEEERVR
jgi:poly-gamma-glutamate synthesis protein (capsule biosynthesis protein)